MSRTSYKQKFDRLYEESSPQVRALFDNPATRESATELYFAWQKTKKSPKPPRGIDIQAEARARVYHDIETMFFGFMAPLNINE